MHADPLSILQQYWGHSTFRPMQEDIIRAALDGRDTLALLPTGGGKSVCFQVPALCKEGICIVVSPLIALMKDQVYNLERRGIPAKAIYSGMSRREIDIILENAAQGGYKFLYVSPERLRTELAQARIQRMNVNLLAVDEAHCISQWGYDFRPPYLQIAELRKILPNVPVLALTATATSEVLEDIQDKLAFRARNVFRQSFLRSNLSYSVLYETQKQEKLLDILKSVPGSGIVYVRSRGETREVARFLQQHRISADFYHAGLTNEERSAKQEAWIAGKTRIMACTNAFGMGIDKPDVRIVVHLSLPEMLEAYFQEAGRAGRDGKKAYATLLHGENDTTQLRFAMQQNFPALTSVRQVYRALGSHYQLAVGAGQGESFDFDLQHFTSAFPFDQHEAHIVLKLLEQEGWLSISDASPSPARLQILANRQTLYDYQLRNKQADTVIKIILRAYPGIQEGMTDISENMIAQYAKMPTEVVIRQIQNAQQEGILQYEPRKEKPQLTFLRERVAAENLTIDLEKFKFRKEQAEKRLEAAIHYAERRLCRSQLLLAYFNEPDSPACGICDICTGRNEPEKTSQIAVYEKKIMDLLRKEALTQTELLEAFPMKRHEAVMKALTYMVQEQKIRENELGKFVSG